MTLEELELENVRLTKKQKGLQKQREALLDNISGLKIKCGEITDNLVKTQETINANLQRMIDLSEDANET